MTEAKLAPGLPDWMVEHANRYIASGGADGHMYKMTQPGRPELTVPALLLTTTGRKSGERYIFPLFYGKVGDAYLVIASKGGAPKHPSWYLNILANPDVEVQAGTAKIKARARTATGAERARLWEKSLEFWPPYADYQKKTEREIPVVVLDPSADIENAGSPPAPADKEVAMPEPERIDRRRAALIAYDVCRRALTPSDPARKAAMRPVLEAWMRMIAVARAAGVPVIYTTPVSRADGADVVILPTDLSAETGIPPLTNGVEGTPEAGFPDEIAPLPEDYVFLKRRPSAFYGTGVAELLHMLRRDTIIIGGGATNRGVETSVREAFNLDLASVVVRDCCWSGDPAAHAYSLDKAMKMYARIRSLDQAAALLRE